MAIWNVKLVGILAVAALVQGCSMDARLSQLSKDVSEIISQKIS